MNALRNVWYIAAWADELQSGKPLARTICDEPLVLFRTGNQIGAMQDRCPHRFAPLSYGSVKDGQLECRYHGLRFDGSGACVGNPHGPISRNAQVAAYAAVEAHKIVWIWMGDRAEADPALIPDLGFLTQVKPTAFNKGYLRAQANYLLLVDNILDLSHVDFLHPGSLGGGGKDGRGSISGTKPRVDAEAGRVLVRWNNPAAVPSQMEIATMGFGADSTVRRTSKVEWRPAATMVLTSTIESGEGRDVRRRTLRNIHAMSPESATTTHYFFASTRDFREDDGALNERIAEGRRRVFETEDEWMCRGVQERMGNADFWDLRPVLMSTDTASVQVRRSIARLLEEEARRRA